jgi:hypothetical protein
MSNLFWSDGAGWFLFRAGTIISSGYSRNSRLSRPAGIRPAGSHRHLSPPIPRKHHRRDAGAGHVNICPADTADPAPAAANKRWADARRRAAAAAEPVAPAGACRMSGGSSSLSLSQRKNQRSRNLRSPHARGTASCPCAAAPAWRFSLWALQTKSARAAQRRLRGSRRRDDRDRYAITIKSIRSSPHSTGIIAPIAGLAEVPRPSGSRKPT